MIRILIPGLFLMLGFSASAQMRPMFDPYADITGHYQTDAFLPVQENLKDCHLFDALGWDRRMDDIRKQMSMACTYLARQDVLFSDMDRALAHALLAFEDLARKEIAQIDEMIGNVDSETGAVSAPGSAMLRTGWWQDSNAHERLFEALDLHLIMGAVSQ